MEEFKELYDKIKYNGRGSVLILPDPVDNIQNCSIVVARCFVHIQQNCRHEISFEKISPNMYYTRADILTISDWAQEHLSGNKYILLESNHINMPDRDSDSDDSNGYF
jgi:hypothetical protein